MGGVLRILKNFGPEIEMRRHSPLICKMSSWKPYSSSNRFKLYRTIGVLRNTTTDTGDDETPCSFVRMAY